MCQHTPGTSLQAMQVSVRLFAALRERAGADALELELQDGSRVADALRRLAEVTNGWASQRRLCGWSDAQSRPCRI
jgi:molybdopterin converting factor small subunit